MSRRNQPPSNLGANGLCGVFHPRVAIGDYCHFDPNDPRPASLSPFKPPAPSLRSSPSLPPPFDSHHLKTAQVEIWFFKKNISKTTKNVSFFSHSFFFFLSFFLASPSILTVLPYSIPSFYFFRNHNHYLRFFLLLLLPTPSSSSSSSSSSPLEPVGVGY